MHSDQRQMVFGKIMQQLINTTKLKETDGDRLVQEVSDFYKSSLKGDYYEPFDIGSKNYMDIPEGTSRWCNEYGIHLDQTSQLSLQGLHHQAIKCFQLLFDLIDKLGQDKIIFADEVGSWMVGGNDEQAVECYIVSLAKVCSPSDFTKHMVVLLKKDSYESFKNKVFEKATAMGTKAQIACLNKEAHHLKIKTDRNIKC